MAFGMGAIAGLAKKAVADTVEKKSDSLLGQGVAAVIKPGQTAPGAAPEEFQTNVTDGGSSADSVIDEMPTLAERGQEAIGQASDMFANARQDSQARLNNMRTPEEIAAQGPISRILSSYGE
jgi:hypothetical protein